MGQIKVLQNPIQHYDWGSYTAIPSLLGRKTPADEPWAEMWMGAHPRGTSRVVTAGRSIPLDEWIAEAPEARLGRRVAAVSGAAFPFLFKVLAAEAPLSIQAHPDKIRAREGFLQEEQNGIPRHAPDRNYRDDRHKPECICALTPFTGLCGFRQISEILGHLHLLLPHSAETLTIPLKENSGPDRLAGFLRQLLRMGRSRAGAVAAEAAAQAAELRGQDPACDWVTRLYRSWPEDIMILAPVILNLFVLQPGQALFLRPGLLHAYLNGTGIEVMANSDNVLRGGLTRKHVDPEALLRVLDFSEMTPRILAPAAVSGCESIYATETDAFALSVIRVVPGQACHLRSLGSIAILLCTAGEGEIVEEVFPERTRFRRGTTLLVPADVGQCSITGEAELYQAAVPVAAEP
ncbi:MAG: mannose-6-phosphate isomerase, class I [Desulfosudaceae bacterium]